MVKNILIFLITFSFYYLNSQAQASKDCVGCQNDSKPTVYLNGTNAKDLSENAKVITEKATTLTRADKNSFCALIVTDLFEDAEAYLTSKGIELKDVYKDINCGSYETSLLSYVIKASNVRNFLMLRRYILKHLGNNAYVEFINVKSPFSSVSNKCPLEVTKAMLSNNPSNEDMQKIQSLLVQYGAVEDC